MAHLMIYLIIYISFKAYLPRSQSMRSPLVSVNRTNKSADNNKLLQGCAQSLLTELTNGFMLNQVNWS